MHAHFHVVPRFSDDGLKGWPDKDVTNDDLEAVQAKIVNFLK